MSWILGEPCKCPHNSEKRPMAVRYATAPKSPQKAQRELEDLQLVLKARNGDNAALDALIRRYTSFVRLKASSYFLVGGDGEDLVQEGLIGLYKAVRDFRADKETSFRSFAELCVTRQIITAIKTATRYKHVAAEQLRLVQPHPGRPGLRLGVHARRRAPGPEGERPVGARDLDRGAAVPRRLPRQHALPARVRRAPPLPRRLVLRADGRASSAATRRRSTTRSSGSSARS